MMGPDVAIQTRHFVRLGGLVTQAHLVALVVYSKVMAQVDKGVPNEGDRKRRKRRDRVLLIILLLAVVSVTALGIAYLLNRGGPEAPVFAPAGVSVPHYLFSIDGIPEPVSVAASPLGDRIFVAEGKGARLIHIFDRDGNELTAFELPREPLESRSPGQMAIGNDDRLYVIDDYQHEMLIFDLDGEYIGDFVPESNPDFEWIPTSVFLDDVGRLYVTEQTEARHRVMVFDASGGLMLKFGVSGSGNGMFLQPTDIMLDDNDLIYVADSANSRIQVFDLEGKFVNAIHGTDMSLPVSLFMDAEGRLHVLDGMGHSVVGILLGDPPEVQFRYGALGRGMGEMYFPRDLTRDETGRIYVADKGNNRVHIWSF